MVARAHWIQERAQKIRPSVAVGGPLGIRETAAERVATPTSPKSFQMPGHVLGEQMPQGNGAGCQQCAPLVCMSTSSDSS